MYPAQRPRYRTPRGSHAPDPPLADPTRRALQERLPSRAGGARVPVTALDLALFTGAVYGGAWILTKSSLLRAPRAWLAPVPLAGTLARCVVCASAWVAALLALTLPATSVFSPGFRPTSVADVLVLMAWSVATSWALAQALGDAD